ncbi:MAG: Crp/Fnr family transcriptional regulator [Bacteriovoracaceae bacterium]
MAWPVHLEPNQVLMHEGDLSQSMYLVLKGELQITKKDGDKELLLGYIKEGELVGELSFLDQLPRSATVKAVTVCELIQIPPRTVEEVFKNQPKWLEILVHSMIARLREANQNIRI